MGASTVRYILSVVQHSGRKVYYGGTHGWIADRADAERYYDVDTATEQARRLQQVVQTYVTVEVR